MNKHILGIDYLRSASTFAVVWIHAAHTNEFTAFLSFGARFAVPCFIMISIYLLGFKIQDNSLKGHYLILNFIKKLAPQYVFWNTLYIIFQFVKYKQTNMDFYLTFDKIFLGTSAVQLWFLPAIVLWYSAMVYIYKYKNFFLDMFLMIIIFIVGHWINAEYKPHHLFFYLCANTYYLFIAKIIFQNKDKIQLTKLHIILGIVILAFLCAFSYHSRGSFFNIVNMLFSTIIFIGALQIQYNTIQYNTIQYNTIQYNLNLIKMVSSISKTSFGIYLSHFAFIQIILLIENILGISFSLFVTLFNILITFVLSYILTYLFQKSKILEKVV